MSVDKTLIVMYGWKSNKSEKHCPRDKEGYPDYDSPFMCGQWNEDKNGIIDYVKNPTLYFCEDDMCGDYEYLGIPIYYADARWGEPELHLDNLNVLELSSELCDLIDRHCDYLIKDGSFDVCGLLDGKLPQLHIFIKSH